jgi:phosphate transport system permease protein
MNIRLLKDKLARNTMMGLSLFSIMILLLIGVVLLIYSLPTLTDNNTFGLFFTSNWKPFKGEFGFGAFIYSTLLITLIAIILAFPPALLCSLYMSEYATATVKRVFSPVIDLLSGIPPVIYGVWGTLRIVPFISEKLAPLFVDFSTGYSVLAGGVVLAIMILPLIVSILIEVFSAIPQEVREASLSLGATKWQTVKKVILKKSLPGIIATIVLAISRAFGETIAVLMVCGNFTDIPQTIFDACYPLPALIANNYGEMMSIPGYESALMFAAFLLFIIIVLFNAISRLILYRLKRRSLV